MKQTPSSKIAFGGVMAALALVVMNLIGLIPVATFVCPMLCMMLLTIVKRLCGKKIGWAWYGAVAILCVLLAPDKEAAAIFACLGYYPLLKPKLDSLKCAVMWKLLFFNTVLLLMYWMLIHLLGMEQIAREYAQLGIAMTAFTLLTGNLMFWMLDRILGRLATMDKRGRK